MDDVVVQFLVDLVKMAIGVALGTFIGMKITKRELKKEVTSYITNEVPRLMKNLMKNKQFKHKIRSLAQTFVKELMAIIREETKKKMNAEPTTQVETVEFPDIKEYLEPPPEVHASSITQLPSNWCDILKKDKTFVATAVVKAKAESDPEWKNLGEKKSEHIYWQPEDKSWYIVIDEEKITEENLPKYIEELNKHATIQYVYDAKLFAETEKLE